MARSECEADTGPLAGHLSILLTEPSSVQCGLLDSFQEQNELLSFAIRTGRQRERGRERESRGLRFPSSTLSTTWRREGAFFGASHFPFFSSSILLSARFLHTNRYIPFSSARTPTAVYCQHHQTIERSLHPPKLLSSITLHRISSFPSAVANLARGVAYRSSRCDLSTCTSLSSNNRSE